MSQGATKPMHHNQWTIVHPRARSLQQEKSPQWEAYAPWPKEARFWSPGGLRTALLWISSIPLPLLGVRGSPVLTSSPTLGLRLYILIHQPWAITELINSVSVSHMKGFVWGRVLSQTPANFGFTKLCLSLTTATPGTLSISGISPGSMRKTGWLHALSSCWWPTQKRGRRMSPPYTQID